MRDGERTVFPVRRFAIPVQVVHVDGAPVSAFEFGTAQRLATFRIGVSAEGDEIPIRHDGIIIISWDPPWFYASGKLLVLFRGWTRHHGDTERPARPPVRWVLVGIREPPATRACWQRSASST